MGSTILPRIRGKRYGTVIIDLETHRLRDLLPDREAGSVKQWLVAHPEIEIVSRDRAGAYADGASQAKTARKQAVVDHVKSLHQEGNSLHTIAARLDLARNTVRRYVRMDGSLQPTPRPRKPSQLDPFYDDLCQRFKDGCSNAHQLFAELQEQGYRGGKTSVRSVVACLRKGLSGMARPPKHAHNGAATSAGSPRELRWLLAKREEDLTPEERQDLNRLLESSQEVKGLYCLLARVSADAALATARATQRMDEAST